MACVCCRGKEALIGTSFAEGRSGSVWESNPQRALFKPSTGFEDQGPHQRCKHSQEPCFSAETAAFSRPGDSTIRPAESPSTPALNLPRPAPLQVEQLVGLVVADE